MDGKIGFFSEFNHMVFGFFGFLRKIQGNNKVLGKVTVRPLKGETKPKCGLYNCDVLSSSV